MNLLCSQHMQAKSEWPPGSAASSGVCAGSWLLHPPALPAPAHTDKRWSPARPHHCSAGLWALSRGAGLIPGIHGQGCGMAPREAVLVIVQDGWRWRCP